MRVAVPLFGREVAPRFGFADSFLIAEVEGRQIVGLDRLKVMPGGFVSRLGMLRDLGVEVLLCGGFNRAFSPLAEDLGIRVQAGLVGDAYRALEVFARGEALPTSPCRTAGRRGGVCEPGGSAARARARSRPREDQR